MARKRCRLWWPVELSSRDPSANLLLFGWCFDSSTSVDLVIAHAISETEVLVALGQRLELQELLQSINLKMPIPLQEASTFCMIGQCAVTIRNHQSGPAPKGTQFHGSVETDVTRTISCEYGNENTFSAASCLENNKSGRCGCQILNQSGNWIHLLPNPQRILCKKSRWIPEFHHMHQNGLSWSNCDVHLMLYELPTYSRHHFSVRSWGYGKQAITPSKKPNWFNELYERSRASNLEAVVWALNCASAAMVSLKGISTATCPAINFIVISRLLSMLWYVLAVLLASVSVVTYVVLQLSHRFLKFGPHTFFSMILHEVFTQTWKNIHIRSCQFLYWPVFLLSTGFREQSNIEYAHMAAIRKHSVWSSIAIDVIMGNVFGFKLNTELAELLGMVSLNAIQVFSTLWFFLGFLWWHFIKGLALSGIFSGLTVSASLCVDMLKFATLHIQTLHWLMSFLYSRQIQALASLWRLFRGRKWNPLRQRLDSYDYTVEQHVVGALFFTPLLLLLPTTSVFYIFFTILYAAVCLICIIIEIIISILHATPYTEILLWVVRKRRFPSGIWFEILSGHYGLEQRKASHTTNVTVLNNVVSLVHTNYATPASLFSLSNSLHRAAIFGRHQRLCVKRPPLRTQVSKGTLNCQQPLWLRFWCKSWRLVTGICFKGLGHLLMDLHFMGFSVDRGFRLPCKLISGQHFLGCKSAIGSIGGYATSQYLAAGHYIEELEVTVSFVRSFIFFTLRTYITTRHCAYYARCDILLNVVACTRECFLVLCLLNQLLACLLAFFF
ncbi:uncharacterized protein LOC109838930 isoform X3 [Asparagus officinalis]|uniref:uncharacterized protein LOC109838930 isoform X3 n=1 Tax=Asparagus officinalis TaxID=4686 RepID=UPI00098E1AE0|nr:uncharacterized protein LOC109838930 isoform X3 [Asparagus officinalis]